MDQIIDIIRNGGLVIMPTDTVYGIIGDATNETTIKKVYVGCGQAPSCMR